MSERDRITSGKRMYVRSEKSSSKRSRQSFRFVHIARVSGGTVATDVRKEAEKYGKVDDVIDNGLYTSSRSGIVSRKFQIKFAEPKNAQRFLTHFSRHNIFGRPEIEVHVWQYDYDRKRDIVTEKENDELESPSLNNRDWSGDGVNAMNSKNQLSSEFELVKKRDNIEDFRKLLRKHKLRGSASEFFEEYELMAVRTNAKKVICETRINQKPDLARLKLDWYSVFLKFAGLDSQASDTNKGAAKAFAELRLFDRIHKNDNLHRNKSWGHAEIFGKTTISTC